MTTNKKQKEKSYYIAAFSGTAADRIKNSQSLSG